MSFLSILKLSFHNLFQNKTRTVLTVIVLFVMSLVVMFVAGFAFSFYDTMVENFNVQLQKEGADFNVRKYEKSNNGGPYNELVFSVEELETVMEKLEKAQLFSVVKFWNIYGNSYGGVYDENKNIYLSPRAYSAKFNSFADKDDYVVRGRMWGASDDNSTNVWLSASLISKFELGEKISLPFSDKEFTVVGFLEDSDRYNRTDAVYLDYRNFNGSPENNTNPDSAPYISSLYAQLLPDDGLVLGPPAVNKIKEVSKDITDDSLNIVATSYMVENFVMADYMLLGMMGLVAFLGVIIILLSIGSVANTIKITVEQNRKFFGMMKAVGMKNGSVRAVVNWQTVIMTVFAVLIATGVAYGLVLSMKSILTMLAGSLFGAEAVVVCTLNPLIPLVTTLVILLFIYLFTRKSLGSISKMDVISVISEVN